MKNNVRAGQKSALDCVHDIYRLGDLLTAVFRDTDYRFGCLHFTEPKDGGHYPTQSQRGSMYVYETPMVLHPQKGALLLTTVSYTSDDSLDVLTDRIEEDHNSLTRREWKIRDQLENTGYWADRAFVMGVGLVTSLRISEDFRPNNIPEIAILDRPKLPEFATHIDKLFAHYTTPAAHPIDEWGPRLVADITDSTKQLGYFIGEDRHLEGYERNGRELDGLVEPAS